MLFFAGTKTPLPKQRTSKELRKEMRAKIESGEYLMGELVVPRKYKIIKVDKITKSATEEEIEVSGRRIPLQLIRKLLLKKFLDAGVVRYAHLDIPAMTKEEIVKVMLDLDITFDDSASEDTLRALLVESISERNLMFWIDHSSVLTHGHLLMTFKIIYDKRFFLTDAEVPGHMNVQQFVEDPEVYIFARCRDTIVDKLMYSDARLEDLLASQENIEDEENNMKVRDVIRFFNGDHPELQSESGQQMGGHYPCNGCDVPACDFNKIAKGFDGNYKSIEARYNLVSMTNSLIFVKL